MKKNIFTSILFLLFISLSAQSNDVFCEQVSALQQLIKTEHYSPKPLNDSLSKGVYGLFLKTLDPDKEFFISKDYDQFSGDTYELDNYIQAGTCGFIDKYIETLKERILNAKAIIESLEKETLDYSGRDTLYFDADKSNKVLLDNTQTRRLWSKRLRYKIATTALEDDSIFDHVKANFKTLVSELKNKVLKRQLCVLDEMLLQNGGLEKFVKESFLNAMAAYQDPNSTFFNLSEKKLFEDGLSANQLSFGINTEKNRDGDIVIAYITPGSVAYENGSFDPNDIIQSLTSGNDQLETYCISNDDVMAFTNDEKHMTVTFKIKKRNGSIQQIELTKSLLKVEENLTRAYIIDGGSKLGYINIPSFYTDMESVNGLGLANDVAKELYKLNKENITGLILDLRFNGGGSMKEASDLAGMFIDRGPVSVLKYKNGDTYTVRDPNRGTLFNKPIVILINAFSASASEYFASTLQDYNRAILVGSTTHGKASAQVLLPLSDTDDLGFCKLTVEKFYRITGKSHQSVGVIPDIELPSLYDNFDTRERYEDFALQNDSIQTKYKFTPLKPLPIEKLDAESKNRIGANGIFDEIKSINEQLVENYIKKNISYPLTLDAIHQDISSYIELWERYYSIIAEQKASYSVKNTTSTEDVLQYNSDETKSNEEIMEAISKDIYINEAYSILSNYINQN